MKYLITRADDFGSAVAANQAILQAVKRNGYLKNVSCMAAAPCMEAGAEELERMRKQLGICIGLHVTLNSEWDDVDFHSVLPAKKIPTLVDERGVFAMHPMLFKKRMPDTAECMLEISAQLDRLVKLGLHIEYVDTHMLPDAIVPGLMEALTEFAQKHGLLDQRQFYTFSEKHQPNLGTQNSLSLDEQAYSDWFDSMQEGQQYINILHPAYYCEEMKKFHNPVLQGDSVAKNREAEQRLLNSGRLERLCMEKQIVCLRYRDAKAQGDTTLVAAEKF
ncbi:MAG: ChbG/HpnK family deacetylase [Hespellia sp.]|nr:ChbG/HpnK family deacetylase [Hespellia sp.]